MRRIRLATCVLALLFVHAHAAAASCGGDSEFVPGRPGRTSFVVEERSHQAYYRLSKGEAEVFNRNLRNVVQVVAARAHLTPPRGANVKGWLRAWSSPLCAREPCSGAPVAGQGQLGFYAFYDVDGQVQQIVETPYRMDFAINDPEAAIGPARPFAEGIRDQYGQEIMFQPEPAGEIDGVPVYRQPGRGWNTLVFAREGRSWWRPVSVEEWLKAVIRDLEKEVARTRPEPVASAGELYRQWLAERPKRRQELEKTLAQLPKSDPATAQNLRRQTAEIEAQVGEEYRKAAEQEDRLKRSGGGQRFKAPGLENRLERHRQALEAMSPEERRAQAVYLRNDNPLEPDLAPPHKKAFGKPLVAADRGYFDPALPRTALQLLAIRFAATGPESDAAECADEDPSAALMDESLRRTEWRRIRALLGK